MKEPNFIIDLSSWLVCEANSSQGKIDPDKLINAGTQMFLGHHVKPAEPLTADDLHGKK